MKIKEQNNLYLSFLLHVGFVFFLILFTFLTKNKYERLNYVEVSFGLTDELVQTQQMQENAKTNGERLATKAADALPQLAEKSAPKIASTPPKSEDALKISPPTALKNPQNVKQTPQLKSEKVGNLSPKEFLARKEESLRKVGVVTQSGKSEVTDKNKGFKPKLDDIPRSPFDTMQNTKASSSLTPTGVESGKNTQSFNVYKLYLRQQLKSKWNLPNISTFSSSLTTVVSFTVNERGYLVGQPKIVESSQNSEFDKLVLDAVISTFPVTKVPPKDIRPPQTFMAKYNSTDIR